MIIAVIAGCTAAVLLLVAAILSAVIYRRICPKTAKALLGKIPPEKREFNPDESVPRPNTKEYYRRDEWYLAESGKEPVTIRAKDGTLLCGRIIRSRTGGNRWAIAMHGYRIDAREMSEFIYRFHTEGWNVLAPDQRAHGFSGGEYTTFGALEKHDLLQWISYITERNADAQIVLFGGSMGAATVLLSTGLQLPSNVKAAIADSSFVSGKRLIKRVLKLKKIPSFPAVPLLLLYIRRHIGADLKETDVVAAVSRSKTPTLFLHGDRDVVVPFEMMEELYSAASCEKRKVVCSGAAHTQGYTVNTELYWKEVFGFADAHTDAEDTVCAGIDKEINCRK